MMRLVAVILLICQVHQLQSTCLSVLDGEKCEQIQEAGHKLAALIKKLDEAIQEVIFRSFKESHLIIESQMKYLQNVTAGLKISQSPITPIEGSQFMQSQTEIYNVATRNLLIGNTKFMEILKKASLLLLKDQLVINNLLSRRVTFKRVMQPQARISSLDKIIQTLTPEIKTILVEVDANFKQAAAKLFNLLSDSLKMLLKGQTFLDMDKTKVNLEAYLKNSLKSLIDSEMQPTVVTVKEATQEIEIIDSLVQSLKSDQKNILEAINPAKVLVEEELQKIRTGVNVKSEIQRKLNENMKLLKSYYMDLKKSITK